MGNREARYHTSQLLFSSPAFLYRQLPAIWAAGVIVALITGSGVGIRFLITSNWSGFGAWTVGALFVPSLAIASGVLSCGSRLFEVVYIVLWSVGALNAEKAPVLDFMGATDLSITTGMPLIYLALTILLLVAAVFGRQRQLHL